MKEKGEGNKKMFLMFFVLMVYPMLWKHELFLSREMFREDMSFDLSP